MISNKFKLRASLFHIINYIKKEAFTAIPLSIFTPNPNNIYFIPGTRCNSHCIMCLNWLIRPKHSPFKIWKKTVNDIKKISPYIKVNISGGEVLLPGVMKKTIEYSIKKLPYTGITTNGLLIDKKLAKKLIQKKFSNINISLDGIKASTVNLIRGRPFAFNKTKQAIICLAEERKKQRSNTKIIVKTIVMALNYQELPDLVTWLQNQKIDGVYFQPIEPIYASKQTYEQLKASSLWLKDGDKKSYSSIINKLMKMKKEGSPILNDFENLRLLKEYFFPKTTAIQPPPSVCHVDLESLIIKENGDVFFCTYFPEIGNLRNSSLNSIIHSKKAFEQRHLIRSCKNTNTCLSTCLYNKSLIQKLKLFLFLNN